MEEVESHVTGIGLIARQYEIVEKIGEGGFGEVYEGVSLSDKTRVAIKIVMAK